MTLSHWKRSVSEEIVKPVRVEYPQADPMETAFRSGTRFVPVRIRNGQKYLDTHWVTETPRDAVMGARIADFREMGPEWAADNPLVGAAEISVEILKLHTLESLGLAAVHDGRRR